MYWQYFCLPIPTVYGYYRRYALQLQRLHQYHPPQFCICQLFVAGEKFSCSELPLNAGHHPVNHIPLYVRTVSPTNFCSWLSCLCSTSGPIRFIRGQTWALLISPPAAILATVLVFVGSAIWTAIIKKAKDVNSWTIQPAQLPLGIGVSAGGALYSAWVAFGFLVASAIPPTIESASFFRLILTTPEP